MFATDNASTAFVNKHNPEKYFQANQHPAAIHKTPKQFSLFFSINSKLTFRLIVVPNRKGVRIKSAIFTPASYP